jgi:Tfp pilus assembly protein PilN
MRAVNLLPRDEPTRSFEAKRGVVFLGGGGAALVTVAMAALMIGAGGAVKQGRQSLDLIQAEISAVPKPVADPTEAQDDGVLAAEKAARISALSTALGGRIAWDGVLRQISQVLPGDVWLSGLSTTDGDPAAGGGSSLTLNGSTYSQDGVARFLSRISVLPALANVQLQTSTVDPTAAGGIVQFVILAQVKTPVAGASS